MRYIGWTTLLIVAMTAGLIQAETPATVYRGLTPGQLEATLKGSKIDFKKLPDKNPNSFFYDFKLKEFSLRLVYQEGRLLMLDTLLPPVSLEKLNQWNLSAHVTRAALGKDDKNGSYTVIDGRLNLKGGVTGEAIREFVFTFVDDLDQYKLFAGITEPRKEPAAEEAAFEAIGPAILEKIFEELKIQYKKTALSKGSYVFEYQTRAIPVRVTSWGKDLMLEAKFPKISLDKVNKYNLDRKFIRTVSYNNKKGEYTGLEANLGCTGGVTISIVRNFIAVFDEDVREFTQYLKKSDP